MVVVTSFMTLAVSRAPVACWLAVLWSSVEELCTCCTAEPARAQLPRQGRGGILCRLDDDVGQPVAAGEGHDREPVVPQEDPDPWRPHASGSGRQEMMVASRGAFRRPRCTTATTRLRTRPATRPSASMRNTLLPTASPRPAKRPGTLG